MSDNDNSNRYEHHFSINVVVYSDSPRRPNDKDVCEHLVVRGATGIDHDSVYDAATERWICEEED